MTDWMVRAKPDDLNNLAIIDNWLRATIRFQRGAGMPNGKPGMSAASVCALARCADFARLWQETSVLEPGDLHPLVFGEPAPESALVGEATRIIKFPPTKDALIQHIPTTNCPRNLTRAVGVMREVGASQNPSRSAVLRFAWGQTARMIEAQRLTRESGEDVDVLGGLILHYANSNGYTTPPEYPVNAPAE